MSSEKLCLKWNDFQQNILSGFKELRNDTEFTDVTLACEDGQQIEAHKVVLATSSPLFMNLLKSNRHQHPLIYMRGVKSEDLVAIIDFLYCGEANVYQENLNAFLALADELKLKDLTGEGKKEHDAKEYVPPESDIKGLFDSIGIWPQSRPKTPHAEILADELKLKDLSGEGGGEHDAKGKVPPESDIKGLFDSIGMCPQGQQKKPNAETYRGKREAARLAMIERKKAKDRAAAEKKDLQLHGLLRDKAVNFITMISLSYYF